MATYISKDQNWNNESTTYWFDVDGTEYGVVETGPESYLVDHNSQPIEDDSMMSECVVTDEMRAE